MAKLNQKRSTAESSKKRAPQLPAADELLEKVAPAGEKKVGYNLCGIGTEPPAKPDRAKKP